MRRTSVKLILKLTRKFYSLIIAQTSQKQETKRADPENTDYQNDAVQRDTESSIVDGTGFGYKKEAYLNWMRGAQVMA